jgi:murein DD-endopeptidase MepM/ murein hydrolase activator NlpD
MLNKIKLLMQWGEVLFLVGGILVVLTVARGVYAAEGYYKDVFYNIGVGLSEYRGGASKASALGYSVELMDFPSYNHNWTSQDVADQNRIIVGNSNDDNGVLLYPDGEPRFRTIFTGGGRFDLFPSKIGSTGRQQIRDFFNNGGSWAGSCAGAGMAALHWRINSGTYPQLLHLWPHAYDDKSEGSFRVGYVMDTNNPLSRYYADVQDGYVGNVLYSSGGQFPRGVANTEYIATYSTSNRVLNSNPSLIAYKDPSNIYGGRVVISGGHPEVGGSGEVDHLYASVLKYAMAGNGEPKLKGTLQNGVSRTMNNNGSQGHEKIGDLQYHHFKIDLNEKVTNLTVTLDGISDNLDLFLRNGGFAFKDQAGVISSTSGGSDEQISIDNPACGTWYIGVKNSSTVGTRVLTPRRYVSYVEYTGNLGVLNGTAYTIEASWSGTGQPCSDGITPGVTIVPTSTLPPTITNPPVAPTSTPTPSISLPPIQEGYIHPGIDIEPDANRASATYVYSTHAGFVTYAGPSPDSLVEKGWMVQVESDLNRDNIPDIITRYGHLAAGSIAINDFKYKRINYTPECFMDLSLCLGGASGPIEKLPYGYGPYVARNQLLGRVGDTGSPGNVHVQYEIVTNRYISTYGADLNTYDCRDNPYLEVCSEDASRPGFFFPVNREQGSYVRGPVYTNPGAGTPPPAPTPIRF